MAEVLATHFGRTGTLSGRLMSPRATAVLPALRYWRVQRALKQTELAELAGVHWTTVQRIERGQLAEVETIGKLATALKVEPTELMRQPPDA